MTTDKDLKPTWLVDGNLVYKLNLRGCNEIAVTVQQGYDDDGNWTTNEQRHELAVRIAGLLNTTPPTDRLRSAEEWYAALFAGAKDRSIEDACEIIERIQQNALASQTEAERAERMRLYDLVNTQSEKLRVMREPPDESGWLIEIKKSGWLIEIKKSARGQPVWWTGQFFSNCGDDGLEEKDCEDLFTTDSNKAIRFSRREDAQKAIDVSGWTEAVATEHIWHNPNYQKPKKLVADILPELMQTCSVRLCNALMDNWKYKTVLELKEALQPYPQRPSRCPFQMTNNIGEKTVKELRDALTALADKE